ncbi:diguanylate cyclase [uncultured Ilyobacter sp.]|uniref:diguanylate cyclase n=1 Tax=uncultured Ilyobacter sp. TaxID=544433 RepID=UPI0029C65FE0|nr:diguanylate cyclase [uncultured Ilyobacter sp.]
MKKNVSKKYYIIAAAVAIGFCSLLSITFYSAMKKEIYHSKIHEREETIEKFLHYRSETESFFNINEYILKGYVAYLKTRPEITAEESDKYLTNLLKDELHLIRNISTIKDTTIVSVFPKDGNEDAIGVDLAKTPGQGKKVLEVKKNLKQILQGPIELVQGGSGFIIRIPVVNDTGYWGQVSIVINADKFMQKALLSEKQNNLQIALFNDSTFKGRPFLGSRSILQRDPILLDIEFSNTLWGAAIIPKDGWTASNNKFIAKFVIFVLLTSLASLLLYNNIISKFKLKNQVIHDHLTGLYTRAFLDEFYQLTFEKAKRNGSKVLILLLDINEFKSINDNYGHKAGDEVLKLISEQLLKICRKSEAVFRLGGDEFLVIIPDIEDISDVKIIKERIRKAVTLDYIHQNEKIEILSSIGSAIYPTDETDFDKLTHVAAEDMYRQKTKLKTNTDL